ncbi:MAG: hypothetical protein AAF652_21310 [Cyanobacteria bacterium P01_C01_bin.72]
MEVAKVDSVYSQEVLNFIDADSKYFTPLTTIKFAEAGKYFADLAEVLNYSTQRWLNNWLNQNYGENDYCEVEPDWSDWLNSRTQQSVSVAFLAKYQDQERSGNDYPDTRQSWAKVSNLDEKIEIDFTAAIATAHAEDIAAWSSLISNCIPATKAIAFSELTQALDLTPAQIYLGIILSDDRFTISKDEENDFYGGFFVSFP